MISFRFKIQNKLSTHISIRNIDMGQVTSAEVLLLHHLSIVNNKSFIIQKIFGQIDASEKKGTHHEYKHEPHSLMVSSFS